MKKLLTVAISVFLCLCAFASYMVTDCFVNVEVGVNAVHHVEEHFTVDYLSPHHGIERFIPLDYSSIGTHAKITDLQCNQPFSTYSENGCYVMKIGSSDVYLTGKVDYIISYDLDTGADNFEDGDFFIFNLVGTEWDCTFDNVKFSVTVPVQLKDSQIKVYTGSYGEGAGGDYHVERDYLSTTVSGGITHLDQYQGLTISLDLPEGFYQNARQAWDKRDLFSVLNPVICIVLLVVAAFVWLLVGRDNVPIVSAKHEVPQNLSPLEIGFLVDEIVDDRDITAMLYYWADKGYMTINEKKKNKFVFTKIADLPFDVPEYERKLFYGFFKQNVVEVEDLKNNNFFQAMQEAKLIVPKKICNGTKLVSGKSIVFAVVFAVLGIFVPGLLLGCQTALTEFTEDLVFMPFGIMMILGIVELVLFSCLFRKYFIRKTNVFFFLAIAGVFLFGGLLLALNISNSFGTANLIQVSTSMLCQLFIILFAAIMPRRTEFGRKLFEEVLGFREFIDKVSMSELTMMIDKDPCYYYHILSYAIVLHLEDKWADKFKSVAVPPPVWYVGYSSLDYFYWNRMFTKMNLALANSIPPQKNGTSGVHTGSSFNFGGFAGGGFGGGGGHAW